MRFILIVFISLMAASCKPGSGTTASAVTPSVESDSTLSPSGTTMKIGYVNSLELLSLMPEVKSADQKLEQFAKRKEGNFNTLAQQYQEKVKSLQEKGATMSRTEQETAMRDLQGMEQRLQQMQMGSQSDLATEKERLYAPILARADSIIKLIGKEQGYTFIMDTPGILYADTTLNLVKIVAERMGIPYKKETEKENK